MSESPSNPVSGPLHPATPFVRLSPGFVLAAAVFVLEFSAGATIAIPPLAAGLFVAAFIAYLSGLIYWYSWLYSLHKILNQSSDSAYPISPKQAVGYRLIPFFNLFFWNFKWTNSIALFLQNRSRPVHMRRWVVGLWLALATLLAFFDKGLELLMLFSISAYLAGKIRLALPSSFGTFPVTPLAMDRLAFATGRAAYEPPAPSARFAKVLPLGVEDYVPEDLTVAITCGVGAAFGYLICYGFWLIKFSEENLLNFALKIFVVAVLLFVFLDPFKEKVVEALIHHEESTRKEKKRLETILSFGCFLLIVDVAHSLLEEATARSDAKVVLAFGFLVTILFGGTTYLWMTPGTGTKRKLPQALGFLGIGMTALLMVGTLAVYEAGNLFTDVFDESPRRAEQIIAQIRSSDPTKELVNAGNEALHKAQSDPLGVFGSETQKVGRNIGSQSPRSDLSEGKVLACCVAVALAGFLVKRKWKSSSAIAGAVFLASLLAGIFLAWTTGIEKTRIVVALWSAFWWCIGILVFYDHAPADHSSSAVQVEKQVAHLPLRKALILALVLFFGLCMAANSPSLRPHGKEVGAEILEVKADDKSRPYGAENPDFTYAAADEKDRDKLKAALPGEPTLCSPADKNSRPGIYPIAIAAGRADTNGKYDLRFLPGTLTVDSASTRTNISTNASRATVNSPVTFTAAIGADGSGSGTAGGTVTFYSDGAALGTSSLYGGKALYATSHLPIGEHLITASYSGDGNFKSSASSEIFTQSIVPPASRPVATTIIVPNKTRIFIINDQTIDSNTGRKGDVFTAVLQRPLMVGKRLIAPMGTLAILGLSGVDPEGKFGAKPRMNIHLMQVKIGDDYYRPLSILQMQGPPQGREGHIHIPAHTTLQFELSSPLTVNISSLAASRAAHAPSRH